MLPKQYLGIAEWWVEGQDRPEGYNECRGFILIQERNDAVIGHEALHDNREQHESVAHTVGRFEVGRDCRQEIAHHLHRHTERKHHYEDDEEGRVMEEVELEGDA